MPPLAQAQALRPKTQNSSASAQALGLALMHGPCVETLGSSLALPSVCARSELRRRAGAASESDPGASMQVKSGQVPHKASPFACIVPHTTQCTQRRRHSTELNPILTFMVVDNSDIMTVLTQEGPGEGLLTGFPHNPHTLSSNSVTRDENSMVREKHAGRAAVARELDRTCSPSVT